MTPQERDLITALLARLQQHSGQPRDPEADALIRDGTTRTPDALYLLVQTVLIQDMALHDAQNRIAELEKNRGAADKTEAPPSFLPPRAGASASPQGSVPTAGRWSNTSASAPPREPVWSQNYTPPSSAAQAGAPPPYGYGGPGYGPQMLTGGGGGFLRQAAATAAGVVGGSLLFQGLHSMFGPTYGSGFLSGMPMQPGISETVINNYYNDNGSAPQNADYTDAADTQDASSDPGQDYADNDPGFDPGGGDDGGGYDV